MLLPRGYLGVAGERLNTLRLLHYRAILNGCKTDKSKGIWILLGACLLNRGPIPHLRHRRHKIKRSNQPPRRPPMNECLQSDLKLRGGRGGGRAGRRREAARGRYGLRRSRGRRGSDGCRRGRNGLRRGDGLRGRRRRSHGHGALPRRLVRLGMVPVDVARRRRQRRPGARRGSTWSGHRPSYCIVKLSLIHI